MPVALLSLLLAATEPNATTALVDRLSSHPAELDPSSHAPKLYAYLETAEPTEPRYAPAMLQLALSLEQLGYTQAAVVWLTRIVTERADPVVAGEAVARLQVLFDQPHDDSLDALVFGTLDVAALPATAVRKARLTQGLNDLRAGRDTWARANFSQLEAGSPEQAMAQHAMLVTRVKRGEPAPKLLPEFAALAATKAAPRAVKLEAQLAIARLKYESHDYEGALVSYEAVELPQLDPGRAGLYLEEAWTEFRLGHHEKALSLLLILEAPSFDGAFIPDRHLLRAQIYLDRCHYLPARRAARELLRRYDGALTAIRERRVLSDVGSLQLAAMDKAAVKAAQKHLDLLQKENDRAVGDARSLGKPLAAHLAAVYATGVAEGTRVRDTRLDRALEALADRLLDSAEQVRLLEYEIGMKLNARLEADGRTLLPPSQDALGLDDVSYRFSGEYWNDELRDIHITLEDRCSMEASR